VDTSDVLPVVLDDRLSGVFIAYQLDRVSLQPSVGLAALMVFDPGSPG
jgi:hypothetical protein